MPRDKVWIDVRSRSHDGNLPVCHLAFGRLRPENPARTRCATLSADVPPEKRNWTVRLTLWIQAGQCRSGNESGARYWPVCTVENPCVRPIVDRPFHRHSDPLNPGHRPIGDSGFRLCAFATAPTGSLAPLFLPLTGTDAHAFRSRLAGICPSGACLNVRAVSYA